MASRALAKAAAGSGGRCDLASARRASLVAWTVRREQSEADRRRARARWTPRTLTPAPLPVGEGKSNSSSRGLRLRAGKLRSMASTFVWYDLETWGTDPRTSRIAQFAAQRTDLELNPVGAPVDL